MERVFKKFESFEDADRADDEYYSQLSPDQRVDILLELVSNYRSLYDGTTEGFARVFRVVNLKES